MIGRQYNVSQDIAESGVIKIVGTEPRANCRRIKINGDGAVVYWCCESKENKAVGSAFAVGSDEIHKLERV